MPTTPSGMADPRAVLGRRGESLTCAHLEGLGFQVIERNLRVGRLELDIVARRGALVVFCEVRARSSDRVMSPAQSIDAAKVARIRRAAALWLRDAGLGPVQARFDAASVVFDVPGGRLNYLEGAF